jgi:hypothetical protein
VVTARIIAVIGGIWEISVFDHMKYLLNRGFACVFPPTISWNTASVFVDSIQAQIKLCVCVCVLGVLWAEPIASSVHVVSRNRKPLVIQDNIMC